MYNDFMKVYKYLIDKHSSKTDDIIYALTLIDNYVEESKEIIKQDMIAAVSQEQNYDDIQEVNKIANSISKKIKHDIESLHKAADAEISLNTFENANSQFKQQTFIGGDELQWKSLDYDYESTKVVAVMFNNQEYLVKDLTEAFVKVCELLYVRDKSRFDKMIHSNIASGKSASYFVDRPISRDYALIPNTNIYVLTRTNSQFKVNYIKRMLEYFGMDTKTVMLSIRSNYNPKPRTFTSDKRETVSHSAKNSEFKIGVYVKDKMRYLSDSGYMFDQATLTAITDKRLTKQLLGVRYPLLISYEDMKAGKAVPKHYWKDIFIFNGRKYYVTSQWYPQMKELFDKWYKSLKA